MKTTGQVGQGNGTGRLARFARVPDRLPRPLVAPRKRLFRLAVLAVFGGLLAACALRPTWHWSKPGASEADYSFDMTQCKAKTYSGADGMVTQESVRRMQACMEARGWVKTAN